MEYDVFISYRRDSGAAEARLLRQALMDRGKRVFLDVTDLRKGYFDDELLRRISATPNFLPVLTRGALDECVQPKDWFRREITHAIHERKNIIPVMIGDFSFPADLPAEIADLPRHQGVAYSHQYFDAMTQTILEGLVSAAPDEAPHAASAVLALRTTGARTSEAPAEPVGPVHWSYDLIGGAALGLVGGVINLVLLNLGFSELDEIAVLLVCGIVPGAVAGMIARKTRGWFPKVVVGAIAGAVTTAALFLLNYFVLGGSAEQFNRHLPFWLGPGDEHIMLGEAFMLAIPLGATPGVVVGLAGAALQMLRKR